jgi:hypothetical protein
MKMTDLDYRAFWNGGFTWADYLGVEVREHRDLWLAVDGRAVVPVWALEEAAALGGGWKLLVISEDWCGDASNTVPVIAKLADVAPGVELRVVKRDEHPELMDRHLTAGARSIPLIVVLDRDFRPVGQWGPRPPSCRRWCCGRRRPASPPGRDLPRRPPMVRPRPRESTLREILGRDEARRLTEQRSHAETRRETGTPIPLSS